ncbi:50S ribosomal protein L11 methyltransferase [Sinomicrobium weinanense]|uniref:Ribosomal protein L11 methyltransferase n=1 Tax=Sinomicrobium weinanense TaxID=2842200 RepID=A0A926JTG3_9FLAO|nr:50S ribosomal protein L11 methyltransferase [Sinomicrobium weinanense]MBC9797059.1 50S ribosomal protein L11 methyltransferase [Sinomicrobium weinanense]MBU3122054.1 50S ribosomal protein L11 methyltransferase [Sinomicrobium weinanense]
MDTSYIAYHFKVKPLKPGTEILIAELGDVGFESFVENEEGVTAYIQRSEWTSSCLDDLFILRSDEFTITYDLEEIEQVNWNEEWEKNFQPIEVDGLCTVRAPFHAMPGTKYDIIIEPKMSFGTGHHETTHMMIQHLLKLDLKGKKVLDMGCGTGVLAILAEKLGAAGIDAIDIDNWCYENSLENVERNSCTHISVFEGDASLLDGRWYDVVIANINRNILLNDIPKYAGCLEQDGILLLSGFYRDDISVIDELCVKNSLNFVEKLEENHWVALRYKSVAATRHSGQDE